MRCDLYSRPSHGTTSASFDSPWLHREQTTISMAIFHIYLHGNGTSTVYKQDAISFNWPTTLKHWEENMVTTLQSLESRHCKIARITINFPDVWSEKCMGKLSGRNWNVRLLTFSQFPDIPGFPGKWAIQHQNINPMRDWRLAPRTFILQTEEF